ncbi:MAG: SMC-Scp complex subunit ScpB [Moraxellaceae bacterium]|nr:MAG: SMC-Scp complex subunit ScpB [Moraxellaceae bacterium]
MPWDKDKIKRIVEGALFSAGQPMSIDRLGGLFFDEERPTKDEFKEALSTLEEDYAEKGVVLKEVASGYRFQVQEDVGQWVSRLWDEKPVRYSRALLETLALVAYRQPITRGEIEEIRGVSVSSHIMKTLLEREWVRVVGHRDVPGRPAMFATTRIFLDYFDLKGLVDLPPLSEIRDFDKINEELELEDVVPEGTITLNAEGASAKKGEEESEKGSEDSELLDTEGSPEASVESNVELSVESTAELNTETDSTLDSAMDSVADTEISLENSGERKNTLSDLVRQFEESKESDAESEDEDGLDAAVASAAQVDEDLMVAEIVERQLEQHGEVISDVAADVTADVASSDEMQGEPE